MQVPPWLPLRQTSGDDAHRTTRQVGEPVPEGSKWTIKWEETRENLPGDPIVAWLSEQTIRCCRMPKAGRRSRRRKRTTKESHEKKKGTSTNATMPSSPARPDLVQTPSSCCEIRIDMLLQRQNPKTERKMKKSVQTPPGSGNDLGNHSQSVRHRSKNTAATMTMRMRARQARDPTQKSSIVAMHFHYLFHSYPPPMLVTLTRSALSPSIPACTGPTETTRHTTLLSDFFSTPHSSHPCHPHTRHLSTF